jgi:hypothetical protein
MQALRALLHRHRLLAIALAVCALAIKAAVPAGYMVGQHGTVLTIEICADASGGALTKQIVIPSSGQKSDRSEQAKAQQTCPFGAMGHGALAGADPVLLALAIAFILALGFAAAPSAPLKRIAFLRPPLRGPPLHA